MLDTDDLNTVFLRMLIEAENGELLENLLRTIKRERKVNKSQDDSDDDTSDTSDDDSDDSDDDTCDSNESTDESDDSTDDSDDSTYSEASDDETVSISEEKNKCSSRIHELVKMIYVFSAGSIFGVYIASKLAQ